MKRGPRPKQKVKVCWSSKFAYGIGLIVADGNLSKDGRHISFVSVDQELIELFLNAMDLSTPMHIKKSSAGKNAYYVQFSDVIFWNYLYSLGITPAKSKTIQTVSIPPEYFLDFLRGYFDGDGSSYSYYDPLFPNSYRFYLSCTSASEEFVYWLKNEIRTICGINGYLSRNKNNNYIQLKFAKSSSIKLVTQMYYNNVPLFLKRKHLKIVDSLCIINARRGGEIGRHASFRS